MQLTWVLRLTLVFTLLVILMGAYTRLSDAGLGCPDWPGCYGHIKVPTQDHEIAHAQTIFPDHDIHPESLAGDDPQIYRRRTWLTSIAHLSAVFENAGSTEKIAAHHSAIDPLSSGTRHVDSDDETHAYSGDVASYWWLQPDFTAVTPLSANPTAADL